MAHSCMNLEPPYILTPHMLPFSMLYSTSSILEARPSYTMYMWCGMLKSPCSLDSLSRASWTLNYPHNQSIFEVGAKSRFHGNSQKAPEYTFLLLDCSKSSCRWAIRHSLHDGGRWVWGRGNLNLTLGGPRMFGPPQHVGESRK